MAKRRICGKCGTSNAATAKECKDCGDAFRQLSGESAKPDTMCAWNDHGTQCGCRGVASTSTVGGGPWYCREHWGRLQGYDPGCVGNNIPAAPKKRSNAVAKWHTDMAEHIGRFRKAAA